MRLAFIIGANPRSFQTGTVSVISPGKWRIVAEGINDCVLEFQNHSQRLSIHDKFEVKVHTGFRTEFIKRGTEKLIAVFAERIS